MIPAFACTLLGLAALADSTWLSGRWVGPVVWAVLVFVVAESAWRVACTACPDAPPRVLLLAAGTVAQIFASLVASLLGFVGALALAPALLVTGIAGGTIASLLRPAPAQAAAPGPSAGQGLEPLAASGTALIGVVLGVVLVAQLRYTTSGVDGLLYHLPMVAEWLQAGSIWTVDGLLFITLGYPGFREAILAFLSLPLHHDHLALPLLAEFPLFALAVYALVRQHTGSALLGLAASAYATSVPVVARASTSQKNDLALALAFAIALLFAIRLVKAPRHSGALLCGGALGALASTKFTGVAYAAAIVGAGIAWALLRHARPAGWLQQGLGAWALAIATAAVVASPWYLRNVLAFGNPFYPAEVRLAGVTLFEGPLRAGELWGRATVGWNVRPLIEGWPLFVEAYGLLLPLLMAGTLALGLEIVAGRRRSGAAAVPLALALVAGLVFLHQPLNWPSTVDYNYTLRFFMPGFITVLLATATWAADVPWRAKLVAGLMLGTSVVNLAMWARWWWVPLELVLAAAAYGGVRWGHVGPPVPVSRGRSTAVGAFLALAVAAVVLSELRAQWQYHPVYGYPAVLGNREGVGDVYAFVHRNLRGQRIVASGREGTFPLYGDDLSNRVIPAREPLTPDGLLALCEALRADYLVVFAPFPQRDSRGREERFTTGLTMLFRHPGRFSLAFVSETTYVLKVEPVTSPAVAGPPSAVERAERR